MSTKLDAARVVTNCLRSVEPHERPEMLRELLAHTGAALTALEGRPKAAEAVFRLADAMVSSEPSER